MVRLDGRQLRPQQDDARGPRQTLQGSSICDSLEKMLSSSQVVYKHGSAGAPVPAAVKGTSSCMNQVKTGGNRWMSHERAAGSSEHTVQPAGADMLVHPTSVRRRHSLSWAGLPACLWIDCKSIGVLTIDV